MKINRLETRLSSRYDEFDPAQEGNKNTRFADFIIDGKSLYQMLKKHDRVPALGWGSQALQKEMIDYFLLRLPYETRYGRYPILVCPWCADEECGFISVKIDREGDVAIWKDFRIEGRGPAKIHLGPFYFQWDAYEQVIHQTFGMAGTV